MRERRERRMGGDRNRERLGNILEEDEYSADRSVSNNPQYVKQRRGQCGS